MATDKCLTSGLTVPIADGDHDMTYIIESPMKQIYFTDITNDECQFTTTIHIDSIGSGLSLEKRGLTQTMTVFEPHPASYPLDTFRVSQDLNGVTVGDGYLSIFTDNYAFDGDSIKIIVVIESNDGVNP